MKENINEALVRKLNAQDKPYEIRDTKLTGFLLRVQPSGVSSYYIEYARGKRIRIGRTTHFTTSEARQRAKEIIRQPLKTLTKQKEEEISYIDFLNNHHKPWAQHNLRTAESMLDRLTKSFKPFHKLKLNEITPPLIELWSMRQLTKLKPSTINRELANLSSALSNAVRWGFIENNPVKQVKKYKIDTLPIARYLSEQEEAQLRTTLEKRDEKIRNSRDRANNWRKQRHERVMKSFSPDTPPDHLTPMVMLSLNTGLRRGELFSLLWEHINWELKALTVIGHNSKSGNTRHIPLNKEATYILQNWQRRTDKRTGLIFRNKKGNKFNNVRNSWKNLLSDADIIGFRWHDLRHSFASKLVMKGVELNTVRELLGHADLKMTLRYAHLAPEHKAKAVEKLCE